MSFAIYLLGFVLIIVGLALGANWAGVSPRWIAVLVLVLAGMGILKGVRNTKMRDRM